MKVSGIFHYVFALREGRGFTGRGKTHQAVIPSEALNRLVQGEAKNVLGISSGQSLMPVG